MKKINDKFMDLVPDDAKNSYLLWKGKGGTIAYSSHQPVLIHLLNTIKNGVVLEFGVGNNSTRLIHTICGLQGRRVISIDTNKKWFSKFEKYRSKWHDMRLIPANILSKWEDVTFNIHYSIAFIDGAPAELRQPFMEHVKADYYIVHDSEGAIKEIKDVYNYDFSKYKHVFHFKTVSPMTSVLSNLDNVDNKIKEIFE